MGNSDSKLSFKQGIFRLSSQEPIPADDPYWRSFYEVPSSPDDIFSLFTTADIRRARDASPKNIETLLSTSTRRLIELTNHRNFPHTEAAPELQALNCIRVLTRIFPFLYEDERLDGLDEALFWEKRKTRKVAKQTEVLFGEANDKQHDAEKKQEHEEQRPLGEELVYVLVDLLFYAGFTTPPNRSSDKVTYGIWQTGVGSTTSMPSTREMESNRVEVLRLLLTLASKSLYMPAHLLPIKGTKALTYLASCPDKQVVLSVLCSLLNTILNYNPATWRVPYDHVMIKDSKDLLATYSLQFLLTLLIYPVPEVDGIYAKKNYFRHFLGRIHRLQDFEFMIDGMLRILNQPLQASSTYLPGSQRAVKWAPEVIMLFWETLQCNKRFRSFIIDGQNSHEAMTLMLYYALECRNEATKQGVVRTCIFVLQTMSTEVNFGKLLNRDFDTLESFPPLLRIPDFKGSYADFFIIMLLDLMNSSKGKLDAIYPSLLATINNVAPYLEHLSAQASSRLLQLFIYMSSPMFLFANEGNHVLLRSLMDTINAIVEHQYDTNGILIRAIFKYRQGFEALRSFTLETGQEELQKHNMRRKDSGQSGSLSNPGQINSHGGSPSPASRTASLGNVPEHGAFAIGEDDESDNEGTENAQITPQSSATSTHTSRAASISSSADDSVPMQLRGMSEKARGKMPAGHATFSRQNSTTSLSASYSGLSSPTSHSGPGIGGATQGSFVPTAAWIDKWLPTLPLHTILTLLSHSTPPPSLPSTVDKTPARIHCFEWTPLSLGWYESLLWGFIFAAEMNMQKGAVGVWNGTSVRLFRVQVQAPGEAQGPSLAKPMGAVDAVGSRLVSGIGSLGLRSSSAGSGPDSNSAGQNNGAFRDV